MSEPRTLRIPPLLLRQAQFTREPLHAVQGRFALERLLDRVMRTATGALFVLKGAPLVSAGGQIAYALGTRPAFRYLGSDDPGALLDMIRDACELTPAFPDDIDFLLDNITGRALQERGGEDTVLLQVPYRLGVAEGSVQCTVEYAPALVPEPETAVLPALLGFPNLQVPVFAREATVAEQCVQLVRLGIANTRMKDYYDMWMLCRQFPFTGEVLRQALAAVFTRRGEVVGTAVPFALTGAFAADPVKRSQWKGFLRESGLPAPAELDSVVTLLRTFLHPPLAALGRGETFVHQWSAGGPWDKDTQMRLL